jgi:hypothetical protein
MRDDCPAPWRHSKVRTVAVGMNGVTMEPPNENLQARVISHLTAELSHLHDTLDNFFADNGFTAENGYEDYDRTAELEPQLIAVTREIQRMKGKK